MTEVLEHLNCPIIALQEIWQVLKEKGIFIISTPNSATVSNFLCNLFLRGFKHNPGVLHVTIFDTRQLIKTLKFAGFDVLTIKGMGLNFPILSKSHILASVFDSGAKFIPQIAETIILKARKSKPGNTKQIIKRLENIPRTEI
jgi:SAM-dependent methyltransferase